LRDSLLEKLTEKFEGKFTKDDLKREWHNLQTTYKREKAREEGSKSSGSGTCEVYTSSWEYFSQMEFLDVTGDVDMSYTSMDGEGVSQPPKKISRKQTKQAVEDDPKWLSPILSCNTTFRNGLILRRKSWTFFTSLINKNPTITA